MKNKEKYFFRIIVYAGNKTIISKSYNKKAVLKFLKNTLDYGEDFEIIKRIEEKEGIN